MAACMEFIKRQRFLHLLVHHIFQDVTFSVLLSLSPHICMKNGRSERPLYLNLRGEANICEPTSEFITTAVFQSMFQILKHNFSFMQQHTLKVVWTLWGGCGLRWDLPEESYIFTQRPIPQFFTVISKPAIYCLMRTTMPKWQILGCQSWHQCLIWRGRHLLMFPLL